MARFRRMTLTLDKTDERKDDASIFSDGGFVLEEFQSGGESDADSSDSLDEPQYKSGNKRKAAEQDGAVNSLTLTLPEKKPKNPKKRVGRKAAWPVLTSFVKVTTIAKN